MARSAHRSPRTPGAPAGPADVRPALALLAVLVAVGIAACGSADVRGLPPAAEPPEAPPLVERPAGRVVQLGPPIEELTAERTASPGGAPEGMVFDPGSGRVAVGVRRPPELVLVDGRTGRVAERVPIPGGPRHLSRDGGDILTPAETANRFFRIRAADGKVLEDVGVGDFPHDLAPGAKPGQVLVGDERGDGLSVVEAGRKVADVEVAAQPGGVVPVDGGRQVAVISVRERVVETFDTATLKRRERADAGVGPTHGAANDQWLWVTDTQGDALLVFRTRPELELVRRVFLPGGPYGIAFDPERLRLWITLTGRNRVVELSANGRPQILRTFPTVRQPNTVAVDPETRRVFVGGRQDGELQYFDPGPLPPEAERTGRIP